MPFNMPNRPDLSPIIKWAGGKEKEVKHIIPNSPMGFNDYYEPFVGGGAVYTSFRARHYFVNDISSELVSLYRYIATSDAGFYRWMDDITVAWKAMLKYVNAHKELVNLYLNYRKNKVNDAELKALLIEHVDENKLSIKAVLPASFIWHESLYFAELKKNLVRKLVRMRKIEQERHLMPDDDIYDNIETAFMSALYMYFRGLYNDEALKCKHPDLAIALFVFIRNYAYSGMFRYNDKSEFNVPYGGIGYNHKLLDKKIAYYRSEALLQHLKNTVIENRDFEEFFRVHQPKANDFIFLDPPYDSEFSTYAQNEFTKDDQQRLAHFLCNECKAHWMMVIKYTPFIYSLYADKGLTIKAFDKKYLVSFMNRNDKNAEHLIIMNY